MKSIADKVHEALTREDREIGAGEVLKRFFMIDTNNEEFAEQIVSGVLSKDPRFRRTVRGTWEAVKVRTLSELPLSETPFVLFQIDNAEDFIRGTRLGGFGPGPKIPGASCLCRTSRRASLRLKKFFWHAHRCPWSLQRFPCGTS
jgi:hypothetical protein